MSDNQNITISGNMTYSSVGAVGISAGFIHAKNGIQVHHHHHQSADPVSPQYYDKTPGYLQPDRQEPTSKRNSGVPITNEIIYFVANHISKDWRKLGISLDLENHELDNIFKDNEREGNVEVAFHMLRRWREKCFRLATRELLAEALLKIERSDIVEQLPSDRRPE